MAVQTGRTVDKYTRFCVDFTNGTPAEIPVDSISPVGFVYDEEDLTACQDQVKGYLAKHPDASIDITGPWDTSAIVAISATTVAPALSGSHTVLAGITAPTFATPLGLCICYGVRHWWEAGEPVFGVVAPSTTEGYHCTKYVKNGPKYEARFVVHPGSLPAWGTAIIT